MLNLNEGMATLRGADQNVINRLLGFAANVFEGNVLSEFPNWAASCSARDADAKPSGNPVLKDRACLSRYTSSGRLGNILITHCNGQLCKLLVLVLFSSSETIPAVSKSQKGRYGFGGLVTPSADVQSDIEDGSARRHQCSGFEVFPGAVTLGGNQIKQRTG